MSQIEIRERVNIRLFDENVWNGVEGQSIFECPGPGIAPIAIDPPASVQMLHNSDEVQTFSFGVGFNR